MTCANFWPDWIIRIMIKVTRIFTRLHLRAHKLLLYCGPVDIVMACHWPRSGLQDLYGSGPEGQVMLTVWWSNHILLHTHTYIYIYEYIYIWIYICVWILFLSYTGIVLAQKGSPVHNIRQKNEFTWSCLPMETFSALITICEGNPTNFLWGESTGWFPSQRVSNAKLWCSHYC